MPIHASTETRTYNRAHTHTHQALCEVIEAFIQMVMSWGTGLPEELLFIVRENREDWALYGLSLSSSSSSPLFSSSNHLFPPPSLFALHLSSHSSSSAQLNQHSRLSCCRNPLLLLLQLHIPSYFHVFVSPSVRTQWTKQSPEERRLPGSRMDGLWPLQWGCAWDRVTKVIRTHTHAGTSISRTSSYLCFLCICHFDSLPGWNLLHQQ